MPRSLSSWSTRRSSPRPRSLRFATPVSQQHTALTPSQPTHSLTIRLPAFLLDSNFFQHAQAGSFWLDLYASGQWKKVAVYAVEAYGIFKIGEIIGRRHVVGYKLGKSTTPLPAPRARAEGEKPSVARRGGSRVA